MNMKQYLKNKNEDPNYFLTDQSEIDQLMQTVNYVRHRIELLLGFELPGCLINLFAAGSNGNHVITRADVPVVMLPLSANQIISFKSKDNAHQHEVSLIDTGSIVIISHPIYEFWNSTLLPVSDDSAPRIMLTFSSHSTIQSIECH